MNKTPKERILWKMNNVLRGQAMFIREDRMTPYLERLQEMEVIETLKHFLDNYDEYKQVILDYEHNKNKEEKEREDKI